MTETFTAYVAYDPLVYGVRAVTAKVHPEWEDFIVVVDDPAAAKGTPLPTHLLGPAFWFYEKSGALASARRTRGIVLSHMRRLCERYEAMDFGEEVTP